MDGEGDIDWYFEKGVKQQNLINIIGMDTEKNWSYKKVKTKNSHGCFEMNSKFRTSLHCFFFLSISHTLKTWFELSRVKLYRNDLKGNKNYFELAGGSSYRV